MNFEIVNPDYVGWVLKHKSGGYITYGGPHLVGFPSAEDAQAWAQAMNVQDAEPHWREVGYAM